MKNALMVLTDKGQIGLRHLVIATIAFTTTGSVINATPTVFYFKRALTSNTVPGGTETPDILFVTPLPGIAAPTYTQDPETVTASGNGASAQSTYSAYIAPGWLRASSSSITSGLFSGVAGEGMTSSAEQALSIEDSLTATGGSPGSPINLSLTLRLDALLTYYNIPTHVNPVLCGYGGISLRAAINDSQVASLGRNLCSGSDSQTTTASFNVTDGTPFDLTLRMDIFTQSAIGAGSTAAGHGVSINALNSGEVFVKLPAGVQLTSDSGHSYISEVPEPGSFALGSSAVLGLIVSRLYGRKRRPRH